MDVKIKRATPKHCSAVLKLAKEGNLFNYTHLFYAFLIAMGWLYIVTDDEVVIGYVCYLAFPIVNKVFAMQIGISEKYRGSGLGAQTLEFLCQEVKRRHNTDTILAHTLKPRVVRFFRRESWKVIGSVSALSLFLVKKKIRQ